MIKHGTKILTPNGEVDIENICVGDMLISNNKTGQNVIQVVRTYKRSKNKKQAEKPLDSRFLID